MNHLHHALGALSKAIRYKNLTGASQHIGLSQPQLSRLISMLESELNVQLLDRSSPRHTQWTSTAEKLAEIYRSSELKLEQSIGQIQKEDEPTTITIGTLEGLSHLAFELADQLLKNTTIEFLSLDIYDLNDMESEFLSNELDLIFTSRTPGKKKFSFEHLIGHQGFVEVNSSKAVKVLSPFEYDSKKTKSSKDKKCFVSNSVTLRKRWLEEIGGHGRLPGPVEQDKRKETAVLVVGQDQLSKLIWQHVLKL